MGKTGNRSGGIGVGHLCILIGALALVMALWMLERFRESRRDRAMPILMYHRVGLEGNSPWCVPVETFKHHLRQLKDQGYVTVLPADLRAHRRWGKPLPSKPVMLTFDDGTEDALSVVEPLLKSFGFQGVVYVITGALAETPETRQPGFMIWPEVRGMAARRTLVIGSHGHQHANLIVNAGALKAVAESHRQLGRHGIWTADFCYPYGQYNVGVCSAVNKAGFTTAMVCEDAVAHTGRRLNLMALPRVSVMGGTHWFQSEIVAPAPRPDPSQPIAGPIPMRIRVSHEGVPLMICLRLCGSGMAATDGWLAPADAGKGPSVWVVPESLAVRAAAAGPLQVQVWDRHRLFRLDE